MLIVEWFTVIPVLRTVGLHEIFVRVEENPPVLIDASHPDGQHWRLQSRAEVHLQGFLLSLFPDEKPDVVTTCHANLSVSKLKVGGVLIVRRHDAVVKVRGGRPRQHQVGEAGRDLVLRVDQRHVRLVLHLSLQPEGEREGNSEGRC